MSVTTRQRPFDLEVLEPRLLLSTSDVPVGAEGLEGSATVPATVDVSLFSTEDTELPRSVDPDSDGMLAGLTAEIIVAEKTAPFQAAQASPSWSGDIPDGTTWRSGTVQRVTAQARVPAGATLVIEPGTIVQFSAFAGAGLTVDGTLDARGTADSPILFTSARDATGLAGGPSEAGLGDWNGLRFGAQSTGLLDHVEVRFGGAGQAGTIVTAGQLTLRHSTIARSSGAGLRIDASNPVVLGNTFRNNAGAAISMDLASNPAVGEVALANNGINGLALDSGSLGRDGFWDDPDIVYRLSPGGGVTVPEGRTLTVAPGQVVKAASYSSVVLQIDGTLKALGTVGQPIIFTSDRDDSVGGDTNNDSTGTLPGRDQWNRIQFGGTSVGSVMDYVEVRHAGGGSAGAVIVNGAELRLSNSLVRDSSRAGVRIERSNPILSQNRFENNSEAAISMDLFSNPVITGVTLAGNGVNGLAVDSGTLPGDGFWDDPDIVYRLSPGGGVTVPQGRTLTVAAGQVVKAASYSGVVLQIDGTLKALGTVGQPIIFTSDRDDSVGGDTNNDSTGTLPGRDQWNRIQFGGTSVGSVLDHVEVRHAGGGSAGAVIVNGAELRLSNSLVRDSSRAGVRLEKSNPILSQNRFENNSEAAISMDLFSNPVITGVTLAGNGVNGLALDSGTLAGDGFWDDPDIVYRLSPGGGVTVPEGRTLTVAAGQVVKAASYTGVVLQIDGTLKALGTVGRPIIFTSDRDDSVGGDTNNDGTGTLPGRDQWNRVEFGSTSTGSVLDHVEVRYAGGNSPGAVRVNGGGLTLSNSYVRHSSRAGVRIEKSNPILSQNRFENNSEAAISMDLFSNPVITRVTLADNGVNGLTVDSGSLGADGFWDDPDIVYRLSPGGGVTVPEGKTLIVAAGQVVKAAAYTGAALLVRGTLKAQGTVGQPIIFTSDRDDSAGGDTNNDGTGTTPAGDQWNRIELGSTSVGSVLDHVQVRYGGAGSAGAVVVDGGDLRLSNSVIRDSPRAGLRIQNANPTGRANSFRGNSGPAVSLDLLSEPALEGSSFANNGANGFQLDSGTLPGDLTLDSPGTPFLLSGDIHIPSGITLTIAPGAVLEAQDFRRFTGDGMIANHGTLRKGAGTSVFSFGPAVVNRGTISALSGNLVFNGRLTLEDNGFISGQPGASITLSQGLSGNTRNSSQFAPLANVVLSGPGSAANPQLFEALSFDRGSEPAGFEGNFAYYSLSLSGGSYVRLVNNARNSAGAGAEAVYVDVLTIASGTTLDLNGLRLYARTVQNSGTVVGGAIGLLPNAGPLAFDAPTPGTIAAAQTVDGWHFFGRAGQAVTVNVATGQAGSPAPVPPQLGWAEVTLVDPNGTVLGTAVSSSAGSDATLAGVSLAQDGEFQLRVRAPSSAGSATGNYVVTVWDATPRVIEANLNQTMTGRIDTPFRTEQWTFSAPAGQVLQFELVNVQSSGIQFTLTGPNGATVFSGLSSSSELITLPASGRYVLTVQAAQRQTGAYSFRLNQSVPTDVTVGMPYSGNLVGSGQTQLFRVQVSRSDQVLVQLQDANADDRNEVYVKLGAAPTRGDHQYRSGEAAAGQQVNVPSPAPGTYYVLVYSESVKRPGPFTLLVRQEPVFLTGVTPDHAGNGADLELTLEGLGFDSTAAVSLVAANGTSLRASAVQVDLPTQLTATFQAGAIPAGVYSVSVTQANGAASLPNAFTSVQGGRPQLEVNLVVPSAMGYHIPGVIHIEYSNRGDLAMPAPILLFRPTQTHADGTTDANAFLTLDGSLVTAGFWTSARPAGFSNSIQILASGATPGVLQPGESMSVPVYYAGWQQPWDLSYPSFNYQVVVFRADDPSPLDWAGLRDSLRPPGVERAAWEVIFSNFMSLTGSTVGEYVRSLGENAAYLAQLGEHVTDIGQLLGFAVAQAEGIGLVRQLGISADAAAAAPGIPLIFSRAFTPSLSGRSRLGPLGRGWAWTGPWDTLLSVAADGTVTITSPEGYQRLFQPDSRGGYLARPTDLGILAATGGGFTLRESSGTLLAYRADGRFDYIEDRNRNRVTASYTGSLLTRLIHSSGQTLQIAYNAAGRITRVTDPFDQATTYSYDAGNEHLLSVTAYDGRTVTYTYNTVGSSATLHALSSITTPDGVRQSFGYDARGRLNDVHHDNNANRVTLAYGPAGQIAATDAAGSTTRYFYDHRGLVRKVGDPIQRNTFYEYDERLRLVQAIDAAGQIYSYAYDRQGNVVQSTDPLGQSRSFTYGAFNLLTSVTDAKGNAIRYGYDARGNLTSTSYPDGTVERAAYDAAGNVSSATNRRGQVAAYEYDTSGRLLSETFADGTRAVFAYGPRGHLTSVTDSTGTTAYSHDAAGRLTQITYPGDRFLKFTYDTAGRRTSMEDQTGFLVRYTYDTLGRLASLTDASHAPITTYRYDDLGYLQGKQNSNGSSTAYTRDAAGQVTQVTNFDGNQQVISRFDYAYDLLGRRTSMDTLEGQWTYSYDPLGQLTHAVFASDNPALIPNQDLTYTYDAAGNRTNTVLNGVQTAYATNSLNQYTSSGAATYAYDADGNLIRKTEAGVTSTLTYDSHNRLVGITAPGNAWSYRYNAAGHLVSATHNGESVSYVTDPAGLGQIVAAYNSTGALLAHYIHGGDLVSRVSQDGAKAFFHFDGTGNTVGLTSDASASSGSYAYQPFGRVLKATGPANAFEFAGAFGVMQAGMDLSWMRARFYDPDLGRFLQADPVGTAADLNLYRYAQNNPVSNVDPSGLALDPATWATITSLFNTAAKLGLTAQADAIFKNSIVAVAEASAEYLGAAEVNVPQLIRGLQGLVTRGAGAGVRVGGSILQGALTPAVTVATPAVTVAAPAATVAAPAATVAAPAAAGAGVATEVAAGAAVAEGIGGWGIAAGAGLVVASGIGGAIVGTIINEAVLSEDTKEIIGDTLLGIWESGGRLITYIGNGFSHSQNVASHDPNDKIGPGGVGAGHYVTADQLLTYQIRFENDSSASAPAQRVTVTDPLEPDLDWSTFELTEAGFGDTLILIPAGRQYFQTAVEMSQNGRTFEVQIELGLRSDTGEVFARFQSIDPATSLPPDALTGFLPPEDGTGRGMGHIGFTIKPKAGLAHGTEIRNVALIVFDYNPAIATDQVDPHDPGKGTDPEKRALVTIDARAPQVSRAEVNGRSPQRSIINHIDFVFDEDTLVNATPGALQLVSQTTGQNIPVSSAAFSYNPSNKTGTFDLSRVALPDGNYLATLRAPAVTDAGGRPLAQDYSVAFHVLAGDANGDRQTNDLDLYQVWQNLLKPASNRDASADVDGNGQVDAQDVDWVRSHYLNAIAHT